MRAHPVPAAVVLMMVGLYFCARDGSSGDGSAAAERFTAGTTGPTAPTGPAVPTIKVRVLGALAVRHAFLWDNGVMYDLRAHDDFHDYPFLEPHPFSEAEAVNAIAQVARNSITIHAHDRGFFLSPVFP